MIAQSCIVCKRLWCCKKYLSRISFYSFYQWRKRLKNLCNCVKLYRHTNWLELRKLGWVQVRFFKLIHKNSLIFKYNLGLAMSVILKER